METVFSLSFLLAGPFWLLMIIAPHWNWTRRIMQSPLVIAPAAVLYLVLVLPQFGSVFIEVLNPTLAWVHFLAFDLFVGRWVYLDSRERGISAWLMAPVLFFTLLLGPIGFLLYLGTRSVLERNRPAANV